MPLMPKRVKWRKSQRGRIRGKATKGNTLAFGEYGIRCLRAGWITGRQIEAGRVAATHYLRREGKVFVRIFPHKPVTKKPAETRMGKGKGELDHWVAVVKRGRVVFEVSGVPEDFAKMVLRLVSFKLPLKTKFVSRVGVH